MSPPGLGWVADAARRASAAGATVGDLAAWAGADAPPGADEVVIDAPAALDGVLNLRLAARDGVLGTLSAWYARGAGPTIAGAEAALGPWTEYPRARGPFEGVFPEAPAPGGWRVVGTLHDPPGSEGRRLVEIALMRD